MGVLGKSTIIGIYKLKCQSERCNIWQTHSQRRHLMARWCLSTTFGSMLKLEPNWNIKLYEYVDRPA